MKSDKAWFVVIGAIVILRLLVTHEAQRYDREFLRLLDGTLFALVVVSILAMFLPALRIQVARVLRIIFFVRRTGPPS